MSVAQVGTDNDFASEALKRHHEQMLDNAKVAIRQVPVAEREFTGKTLVVSIDKLPAAKDAIRKFKKHFGSLFESPKGDAVYQLQIQLFPLTRTDHNQKGGPR